ncbi:MAG: T9SS type A sorting domain-containing protein [Calditrichaceae bacterium]
MKQIYFIFILLLFAVQLQADESPDIGDLQIFPFDNPWNWDISGYEVHPNSDNFVDSIGRYEPLHPDFGTVWQGAPNGIPYILVNEMQTLIPIVYTRFGDESDPGPFPIPLNAPVEGGPASNGDRHVIVIDTSNAVLYELYYAFPQDDHWDAGSGAEYNLKSNELRPEGRTSADAAGLPIFPGLVRYEEVYIQKEIDHALRFTVEKTRREYIWPARHFASDSDVPDYPPMGLRFRLKADFDISGYSEPVRVILTALKKYGMFVSDNGGNWFISGAPDDRWDDDILAELKNIDGNNFEAVKTVDDEGNPIYPVTSAVSTIKRKSFDINIRQYPNPFNALVVLSYSLPEASEIVLDIYEINGRKVCRLCNKYQSAGLHEVRWHPDGLASGVYIVRLKAGNFFRSEKIIYQK